MEKIKLIERDTSHIFIECRRKKNNSKNNSVDNEVEEQTALLLDQHISDGLYTHGIKYFGIIHKPIKTLMDKSRGPNCYNKEYANIFIPNRDGFYHVYVESPKK